MKADLVAQFLGPLPPFREGIQPMDFTPKEISTWVILKVVPPSLTPDDISWLASLIASPINKFIRNGLDVKVCLLKPRLTAVTELVVTTDIHGKVRIALDFPKAREYRVLKPRKNWQQVDAYDGLPNDVDGSKSPKEGEGIQIGKEPDKDVPESSKTKTDGVPNTEVKVPEGADKTPVKYDCAQPKSNTGDGKPHGNVSKPSYEGKEAPKGFFVSQLAGGGARQ
ncbi:hypothetical protein LINPERPRIM_LOCUS38739 [Linum perenne]